MAEEIKNEPVVEEAEEVETPEEELTAETDWEAEAKKARGIAQRLRTKLTKASEKKVEKKVEPPVEPVKKEAKTGELDEMQLDYLDLKGISEQEDIDVIQKVIGRTGQTLREALKDEYVQSKLKANQEKRAIADATPGNTKRSGGNQGQNLEAAIAKYEQSGYVDLPDDFALRSAVINATVSKANSNKPSWHK